LYPAGADVRRARREELGIPVYLYEPGRYETDRVNLGRTYAAAS
jgi:glutamate formiminotransferase